MFVRVRRETCVPRGRGFGTEALIFRGQSPQSRWHLYPGLTAVQNLLHSGFHVQNIPYSSVSLSQRIMSHHSILPGAQVPGTETDPRSSSAAVASMWRRATAPLVTEGCRARVLATPTPPPRGFIFPVPPPSSTVLRAQAEAQKTCNSNHKHLDTQTP